MKPDNLLMLAVCAGATAAFIVLRFMLPAPGLNPADIFKDLAHLFVGGLIGAALGARNWNYGALAALLTLAEVIAFFTRGNP